MTDTHNILEQSRDGLLTCPFCEGEVRFAEGAPAGGPFLWHEGEPHCLIQRGRYFTPAQWAFRLSRPSLEPSDALVERLAALKVRECDEMCEEEIGWNGGIDAAIAALQHGEGQ